jgi:hypothetical protein
LFPANAATPLVSNLNWLAGQSPTPNKVDVKLSPAGAIKLANFNGVVNVIGDVVGYYTNSTLKELATRVAVLEASKTFAVSNHVPGRVDFTADPESVVDVMVTAPLDGQVTVNYSTYIFNDTLTADSVCAPYRLTDIPSINISFDDQGVGVWETAVEGAGDQGSVSGTARFDIAAGATVTYSVACEEQGGNGGARGMTMTAIFTPTP